MTTTVGNGANDKIDDDDNDKDCTDKNDDDGDQKHHYVDKYLSSRNPTKMCLEDSG